MIGRLRGTVLECDESQVLIEAGGVGYEVEVPLQALARLSVLTGSETVLHIHMVVREDAQLLFGFETRDERELFRALIRVGGVGPKLAVGLLSAMDAAAFAACVHGNDVRALTALPGIGKKTAERLIIEMRDRLPVLMPSAAPARAPASAALADAEAALIGLGYKPQDASRVLAQIEGEEQDVERLIRQALKLLSS